METVSLHAKGRVDQFQIAVFGYGQHFPPGGRGDRFRQCFESGKSPLQYLRDTPPFDRSKGFDSQAYSLDIIIDRLPLVAHEYAVLSPKLEIHRDTGIHYYLFCPVDLAIIAAGYIRRDYQIDRSHFMQ